jgi:hypothetical protein
MMPKRRKGGSERARIALWHSIAHIEFVAIDLALDMAGRFGAEMGEGFVSDFLAVAADEALHFAIIERHMATMGVRYGDLPAHDGLWSAAHETRHDVSARLAIVPMVLEARGLDVTPPTLERVRQSGDERGRGSSRASLTTRFDMFVTARFTLRNGARITAKPSNPIGKCWLSATFMPPLSHRSTTQRVGQPVCRGKCMKVLRCKPASR